MIRSGGSAPPLRGHLDDGSRGACEQPRGRLSGTFPSIVLHGPTPTAADRQSRCRHELGHLEGQARVDAGAIRATPSPTPRRGAPTARAAPALRRAAGRQRRPSRRRRPSNETHLDRMSDERRVVDLPVLTGVASSEANLERGLRHRQPGEPVSGATRSSGGAARDLIVEEALGLFRVSRACSCAAVSGHRASVSVLV